MSCICRILLSVHIFPFHFYFSLARSFFFSFVWANHQPAQLCSLYAAWAGEKGEGERNQCMFFSHSFFLILFSCFILIYTKLMDSARATYREGFGVGGGRGIREGRRIVEKNVAQSKFCQQRKEQRKCGKNMCKTYILNHVPPSTPPIHLVYLLRKVRGHK